MGNFLNPQVKLNSICGEIAKVAVLTESIRKGRTFKSKNICRNMVLSTVFKWEKKTKRKSEK